MMPRTLWLSGCGRANAAVPNAPGDKIGAQLNGPERGVCTSGRGLTCITRSKRGARL